MRKPYNLTPLGPTWGRGLRAMEIVGQTIGLLFVAPLVLLYRGLGKVLERLLP